MAPSLEKLSTGRSCGMAKKVIFLQLWILLFSSTRLVISADKPNPEIMVGVKSLWTCSLWIINVYSRAGVIMADLNIVWRDISGPSLILADFNSIYSVWEPKHSSRESDTFMDWLIINSFCIIHTSLMTNIAPGGTKSNWSVCSTDLLPKIYHAVDDDLWDSDYFPSFS